MVNRKFQIGIEFFTILVIVGCGLFALARGGWFLALIMFFAALIKAHCFWEMLQLKAINESHDAIIEHRQGVKWIELENKGGRKDD